MLFTASCGEAPVADTKEASGAPGETDARLVADQKKSIEAAAEEATKLIEADAKAEIDAAVADQAAN